MFVVQPDQTYYIIDMICWRGYSLYDCTAEFRFFWVNSKLTETSAGDPPSTYHRYRFSAVPIYECTLEGLQAAYYGSTPYVKDGLLFYNKYIHCSRPIISLYFSNISTILKICSFCNQACTLSSWNHTPYTSMER